MYVITDSKGVRTLVSFTSINSYIEEVLGLKLDAIKLREGIGMGTALGLHNAGYEVAYVKSTTI